MGVERIEGFVAPSPMEEIAQLIDTGKVKPFVAKFFARGEAAARSSISRTSTPGKVVLTAR
jgi:NADPH:quinone reductase-like Zn-dependent oxidoreductase